MLQDIQNCIIGSKDTAILLKWLILPIGGVASENDLYCILLHCSVLLNCTALHCPALVTLQWYGAVQSILLL